MSDACKPLSPAESQVWADRFFPYAKFSVEQVYDIRRRLKRGESIAAVARTFSAHRTTITKIRDRESWSWLPDEELTHVVADY